MYITITEKKGTSYHFQDTLRGVPMVSGIESFHCNYFSHLPMIVVSVGGLAVDPVLGT